MDSDFGVCTCRYVLYTGTKAERHRRVGFRSAAGTTGVCVIEHPSPGHTNLTTGMITRIRFRGDGLNMGLTVRVPTAWLVGI